MCLCIVCAADEDKSSSKDHGLRALQRGLAALGIAPLVEVPVLPDSSASRPVPLRQSREHILESLELLKNLQGQAAVLAASSQDPKLTVEVIAETASRFCKAMHCRQCPSLQPKYRQTCVLSSTHLQKQHE